MVTESNQKKSIFDIVYKNRSVLSIIIVGIFVLEILLSLHLILGYEWIPETGFGPYLIVKLDQSNNPIEKELHYRTLWDWLELLIIPIVLVFIAYWLNRRSQEIENKQKVEQQSKQDAQKKKEFEQEEDRKSEEALQNYIDRMTDLLLRGNHKIADSVDGSIIRKVARSMTINTLRVLGKFDRRQGLVILFLYESGLINKENSFIDLHGADAMDVQLNLATIESANLSDINFNEANFEYSILTNTDFSNSRFRLANFYSAFLENAQFYNSTIWISNLTSTSLTNANFSKSTLNETDFSNAFMEKIKFNNATLINCNLTKSYLFDAVFQGSYLQKCDFTGAILYGADFTDADLTGAIISEEQLSQARSLRGCKLPNGIIYNKKSIS